MKPAEDFSSDDSLIRKSLFGILKSVTSPRSSLSWVIRGHLARDPVFVSQTYWWRGTLERTSLKDIMPGAERLDVTLPRAFDRTTGTSLAVEEACHLAGIARYRDAKRVLEIGTFDGNTALLLAANLGPDARVVTVDLPPDFDATQRHALAHTDVELNLTARSDLARQYRNHVLAPKISQVYGDSATLDWTTLGGPFDLVFIDGCHSEPYVRSDSLNALEHLAPGGVIVWHDYGMIADVSSVVDQVARSTPGMRAYVLEGTRLAVGLT
jgi:predicted O-methyltransferase YrrM